MLSVFYNINGDQHSPKESVQWYIGDKFKPTIPGAMQIIRVYADGDELEYIKARFDNIPIVNDTRIVWKGDTAQFIYDNL
jgi:hypothetical protein